MYKIININNNLYIYFSLTMNLFPINSLVDTNICLLYTSDAADD